MQGYCYDCEAAGRDPIVMGPTPRELLPQPRCPTCKMLGSQKRLPPVPPTHTMTHTLAAQSSSAPAAIVPFALPAVGASMPPPKGLW